MQALTVPASLDSLSEVGRYVMEAATAANLEKKAAYRLRLAVDEIVTNIIVHGFEEAGLEGEFTVKAELDDTALTLIVEDAAEPFDPKHHPTPDDLDSPLEERDIGGLGVFLALNGVDAFSYDYVDGHNRNCFTMYRPTQA